MTATKIDKRHNKQCALCFLIDAESKNVKFHSFDSDWFNKEEEHVCDSCLNGIKEIRKTCNHQADNPGKNILEGFKPWFWTIIPGMLETIEKT